MKKFLLFVMILSSLSLSAQNRTLYVAIKSGLNLREKPDVTAKVLDKIPYATRVSLLDNNEEMIVIRTEGLHGYWRKVNYNNKTGYIVDSYLFPLPPPQTTVKKLSDYLLQLSPPFGTKLVVKTGDEEMGAKMNKQLYKNGGEWHHYEAYEYGSDTYFLPEFTIQEAFLLLRMIPEFVDVVGPQEEFPRESKRFKKGDSEYEIKVETEMYTEEPFIKRISIEFEHGVIYSLELFQVDNQIVIFYGAGV